MKLSKKAQEKLQEVVGKFQAGDLSPLVNVLSFSLDPNVPAAKWSLANRVLAFAQTGTQDCRGFKQWQSSDRNVKKGSRAAWILRPKTVKKERNGEEYYQCIGFSPISVFAANDTEGEGELPEYQPAELPPLADLVNKLGIELNYTPLPHARGEYRFTSDGKEMISLGTDDTKVFFHELAHAIHNRIERLKGGQNVYQETVAELTATVLMEVYGLGDRSGNCWEYIAHYAKDPITAVMKSLATVEKVLNIIFEEKEQNEKL